MVFDYLKYLLISRPFLFFQGNYYLKKILLTLFLILTWFFFLQIINVTSDDFHFLKIIVFTWRKFSLSEGNFQILSNFHIFSFYVLTHFWPMFPFYTPWKHHKTIDFHFHRPVFISWDDFFSLKKIYIISKLFYHVKMTFIFLQ